MISENSLNESCAANEINNFNNICTRLSKNMLGVIILFCDIRSLFKLFKLNKKFKSLVENSNIFRDFIEVSAALKIKIDKQEFVYRTEKPFLYLFYISDKFSEKYSSSQVEDISSEMLNLLFQIVIIDGLLKFCDLDPERYLKHFKIISKVLELNSNITSITFDERDAQAEIFESLKEDVKGSKSIDNLQVIDKCISSSFVYGMMYFSDALINNTKITRLKLIHLKLGINA